MPVQLRDCIGHWQQSVVDQSVVDPTAHRLYAKSTKTSISDFNFRSIDFIEYLRLLE